MTAAVLEPRDSRLAPRFVPELERAFQARYYTDIRSTLRIVAAVLAALILVNATVDLHRPTIYDAAVNGPLGS